MKKILIHNLILFALCLWASSSAYAVPDGTGNEIFIENVGIGTMTPQGALVVANGNVGIGTWTTAGGNLIVKGGGNVGIGSAWPGQALDVTGTVRMTYFTMSGQIPVNGYVLTSTDSSGDATWSSPGSVGGWATVGNNIYNTNSGNVGINTTNGSNVGIGTSTPQGAFVVMNGNVGIGTWIPAGLLDVEGGNINIGATTSFTSGGNKLITTFGDAGSIYVGEQTEGTVSGQAQDNAAVGLNACGYSSNGYYDICLGYQAGLLDGTGAHNTTSNTSIYIGQNASPQTNGDTDEVVLGDGLTGLGTHSVTIGGTNTTKVAFLGVLGSGYYNLFNVGIGSTGPKTLLDVFGTQNPPSLSANEGILRIASPVTTALEIGSDSGSPFDLWVQTMRTTTDGTTWPLFLNPLGGNISIGTQLTTNKLDIAGNVSIGTTYAGYKAATSNGLIVQGNVGIGTFNPFGGQLIVPITNGNVGIGSLTPGQALDVTGTVRMTYFTMSGQIPVNGYVLTSTDSSGDATWSSPGSVGGWATVGNNIYNTNSGNVGINTTNGSNVGIGTSTPQGAFVVTNGNVGIGTWVPHSGLEMKASFAVYRTSVAASTISAGQTVIGVTSTAATRAITLGTADVIAGRVIIIKDESGGAGINNITINTQGGQTIDGASSVIISSNYGVIRVYSDGSNWYTF